MSRRSLSAVALSEDYLAEAGEFRIDEVAKAVEVPRATLYYYFPGKEHILAHLLASTLSEMAARLEAAASSDGTGRERLEHWNPRKHRLVAFRQQT